MGFRDTFPGALPSRVPCVHCCYARDVDALCAECRIGRCCAPGPWSVCEQKFPGCTYCPRCEPKHEHAIAR